MGKKENTRQLSKPLWMKCYEENEYKVNRGESEREEKRERRRKGRNEGSKGRTS